MLSASNSSELMLESYIQHPVFNAEAFIMGSFAIDRRQLVNVRLRMQGSESLPVVALRELRMLVAR